jgi:hypothetical protein
MWFHGHDAHYQHQALEHEIGIGARCFEPGREEQPIVLPRFVGWIVIAVVLSCGAVTMTQWFVQTNTASTSAQ